MANYFRANRNLLRDLQGDGEYGRGLAQAAKPAAEAVRNAAPNVTGAYARSIRVVSDADGVRIESTDPFAHLVEFGSANNPPYAPMRRGVKAAGLRFEDK